MVLGKTMNIAGITAHLGPFAPPVPWVEQVVPSDLFFRQHIFNDENFPPRSQTMLPRLQARIPKCFAWQLRPGYDIYIWVDSTMSLLRPDSVTWWLKQLEGVDVVVFHHKHRHSIRSEAQFIKAKQEAGNEYLLSRYKGEFLDEQLAVVQADQLYVDDRLYASTTFAYRNTIRVHQMLTEWWVHISRYHAVDQLAFPYVLKKSGCAVRELHGIYDCPYVTHTANREWRAAHQQVKA